MDSFPDNNSNDNNINLAKIPHSGKQPEGSVEQPINNFDNTPLQVAYEKGLINDTPDTAAEFTPKSRNRLFLKIGAVVAGLSLSAGAVILGVNTANSEPGESKPVAEAPVDPSAPVAPVEGETPVEVVPAPSTPEAPVLDTTTLPESVVTGYLFETLTEDQKAFILKVDALSALETRQLPDEEQVKFANFVYDNNLDMLKFRLDNSGLSSVYENANFDTASGMRSVGTLKYLLMASLKTNTAEGVILDKETALKVSVLANPEGNEVRQANLDAQINSWNVNTMLKDIYLAAEVQDSAILDNGDVISNEIVTSTQERTQNTYRVIDSPLVNGETKKDVALVLSVTPDDIRYVQNIH